MSVLAPEMHGPLRQVAACEFTVVKGCGTGFGLPLICHPLAKHITFTTPVRKLPCRGCSTCCWPAVAAGAAEPKVKHLRAGLCRRSLYERVAEGHGLVLCLPTPCLGHTETAILSLISQESESEGE